MAEIKVSDITARCGSLKNKWARRDRKFREWYDILKLKDNMAEDKKESFVSNNPRTFYNLSLHLLTPQPIPHRFPVEGLTDEEIQKTSDAEKTLMNVWRKQDVQYRRQGKQSKMRALAGYILSFGWYAVYMGVTPVEFIADVWHPMDTYPMWDQDRLIEVAHIFKLRDKGARQRMQGLGLEMGDAGMSAWGNSDVKIFDYWFIDSDGDVAHAMTSSLNSFLVPPVKHPELDRIPVAVGPVGGLPDLGQIDTYWQDNYGESIVAVNAEMYRQYDRIKSFLQQAIRDATEPKWLELSSGTEILNEVGMSESGSIFRGSPNDIVHALTYPPIPVELTQSLYSYEQQLQQGSFSPMMFGNIVTKVAAYTLSQMAQAAQQVLRPYHEAMQDVLSEIDNFYVVQSPSKFPGLPKDLEIIVSYPISIPGDLINRATVAKMLAPSFEMSSDTVMEILFKAEINDPIDEAAKARKDKAMNSPEGVLIDQVVAYKTAAATHKKNGSTEMSALYTDAANAAHARLKAMGGAAPQGGVPPPPKVKPAAGPQNAAAPLPAPTPEAQGGI